MKMSTSAKTAIGAMVTALSVVILMPSVIGVLCYALPVIASLLILFTVIEIDKKWAFGCYAATSVLSLVLIANKEAVIYYVAFFGYYPIIKAILEGKKIPRAIEYTLKFLIFNVTMVLAVVVLAKVFGMPYEDLLGIDSNYPLLAKYAVPIMLGLGNVAFIGLDGMLTKYVTVYVRIWQKKFHKLFPFK